ncbi:MFS transporter [Roseomonas sp. BN140053]|uniref:MFS transporter n=1 Tax=Roseomonas sp. BN140053 TaxID=3391898 RepID=UPI0039E8D364
MTMDLLRDREFRAFLVANTLERFAAAAMTVLLGFQVYDLTHDPLDLGWLGLIEAIPGVTLVLYGGHVADRHSRRRIVLWTTGALCALAAAIALLSHAAPGGLLHLLFLAGFLSGVIRAFESPAATGLEAQVVPLEGLLRGVALLATVGRLADVFGPVAGGFAWHALGPRDTYGSIAVLFGLACLALFLGVAEKPLAHEAEDGAGVWQRIGDGIRTVFRSQVLVGSMALDLFAVFFGGATALMPVFATDILQAGPVGYGFLQGASGAGALVAAILAGRFLPQHRAGAALFWVIAGFGVAIVVFGLSTSLPLSLAALFAAGLCDGTSVVIRRAILRLASPEAMRGRISAVKSVFVGSSNEIGAFESGLAASLLGAPAAVWGGGLVTLAVVAVTACLAPKLRQLDLRTLRPEDSMPELAVPLRDAARS